MCVDVGMDEEAWSVLAPVPCVLRLLCLPVIRPTLPGCHQLS